MSRIKNLTIDPKGIIFMLQQANFQRLI